MDIVASLPAFLLAVVLISASPGPALALITRRAALQGARGALPTIVGLEAGLYVWALLAGAGLAALVAASETAYLVLRVVGAIVLLALGIRAWRSAWADRGEATEPPAEPRLRRSGWFAFGEGAVVQLANPKAAVFMFAFYPQFVPADRPLLQTTAALALLQVAIELCLYAGFALAIGRAGAWFRRRTVRRRLEAASGTVLIGLGVRMAVTQR
ncbi:MAG TPA: LysE family translocator [Nocardioidaceae bacterium]|nr:LysE family translocator [Nocardioidaceae bacterium]